MRLQHYLGGLENLGPVNPDRSVFAAGWEKRIFGIHTVMMAASSHLGHAAPVSSFREHWTWAHLRTGAEAMQPFEYFKYRYYEKWLMGISGFFIDRGYVDPVSLDNLTTHYRALPDAPLPASPNFALAEQIGRYLRHGDSGLRSAQPARFKIGDTVLIGDPAEADHTRLPGFLRKRRGVIKEVYAGAFEYFVSTGADGLTGPQQVYSVAFDAAHLWGEARCEPDTVIYADLFDTYIEAAA